MTKLKPAVALVGTFTAMPEQVLDRSLEEMVFEAAEATVADAGVSLDDVDGVVVSGSDQIDGRVISCMVTSGPAGGVNRDLTMIASSSEHALIYGYMRLLAGEGRNVLVLAWGKPSESVSLEHAELVAAEPFILRPHGMNDTLAAALQASALIGAGAAQPPEPGAELVSWPLSRGDVPPPGDAVCGVLLSTEDWLPASASPVWIRGVGWATHRYELGDRDLAGMPALGLAADRAYAMADLPTPPGSAVARVHCPSAFGLDAALRALRLPPANGARRRHAEAPPFPAPVAGLATMTAAADVIRGDGSDGIAVGAALHGFAGQGAAVAVLTGAREG